MQTYIAFLRSINVTGRFVKMEALRAAFESAGYPDAKTYISSGNVFFQSGSRPDAAEVSALEIRLSERLGFESEVFVRTPNEIEAIVAFANRRVEKDLPKAVVQVAFLSAPLNQKQLTALEKFQSEADVVVSHATEIYWFKSEGKLRSRLSGTQLERALSMKMTFRRVAMLSGLKAPLAPPR